MFPLSSLHLLFLWPLQLSRDLAVQPSAASKRGFQRGVTGRASSLIISPSLPPSVLPSHPHFITSKVNPPLSPNEPHFSWLPVYDTSSLRRCVTLLLHPLPLSRLLLPQLFLSAALSPPASLASCISPSRPLLYLSVISPSVLVLFPPLPPASTSPLPCTYLETGRIKCRE